MCQQGLRQLSQEGFEQGGRVIGVEVPGLQVYFCSRVQHLPEGRLSQAVARDPEQPLHM